MILPLLFSLLAVQDIHIVVMDDVGYEDQQSAPTPNLDLLASQGQTFTRAYGHPWCAPTRSSLFRGVWRGYYHGSICGPDVPDIPAIDLDSTETMLPVVAESQGYETFLVGKWHMGHPRPSYLGFGELFGPHSIGFDHWASGVASGSNCWVPGNVLDDGAFRPRAGHSSSDQFTTYEALMNHADSLGSPIFGVLSFTDAHSPWNTPPGFPIVTTDVQKYQQEIEYLDQKIGQLMMDVGPSDWLIVMGDNGTPDEVSPAPGRSKLTVYERGIRIPLIIKGPGFGPGTTSSLPVSVVDVMATVGDLLGVPTYTDGESLLSPSRGWVFSSNPTFNFGEGRHAIIEERWKLIRQDGGEEFYDLQADPSELSPLPLSGPDYDRLKGLMDSVI